MPCASAPADASHRPDRHPRARRSLDNNRIREIPPDAFKNNVNLVYLDLSVNLLGTIPPDAFNTTNLRAGVVDLRLNPLVCPLPDMCGEAYTMCGGCVLCPREHFFIQGGCERCPAWAPLSLVLVSTVVLVVLAILYHYAGEVSGGG